MIAESKTEEKDDSASTPTTPAAITAPDNATARRPLVKDVEKLLEDIQTRIKKIELKK